MDETWIPDGISIDKPSPARIYDYLLGGYHNFESDRIVAERMIEHYPDMRLGAQAGRAFLRRVVNFLVAQDIDQFLDIGSGIPTVGNVHEVAQAGNPAARVVYVDIDSVAIAHSRAILQGNPNATAIRGDLRQPDQILTHAEVKTSLDLNRPVAVLLISVLNYVTDDEEACGAVRTLRDALAPGSYLAIAHVSFEGAERDAYDKVSRDYRKSTANSKMRSYAQIRQFFEGFELIEPGLVRPSLWRPEGPDDVFLDQPERLMGFGGVGHKL
jgi:SAM-dependent methyltransferase